MRTPRAEHKNTCLHGTRTCIVFQKYSMLKYFVSLLRSAGVISGLQVVKFWLFPSVCWGRIGWTTCFYCITPSFLSATQISVHFTSKSQFALLPNLGRMIIISTPKEFSPLRLELIAGFRCHAIQNRLKSKSKPFDR